MDLPKPPDDPELENTIDKLAVFVAKNGPEFEWMTKQKQKENPKFSFLFGGEYADYYQYRIETEQLNANPDLKNIIDKLANFVARNGPEFEEMTKQKQKDNPKFSFLFGGEFFNYYQFKVATEQVNMSNQQKQMMAQPVPSLVQHSVPPQVLQSGVPWQQAPPPPVTRPQPQPTPPSLQQQQFQQQKQQLQQQVQQQQEAIQLQIKQSEQNLTAQYQTLVHQQQVQVEEAVLRHREDRFSQLLSECEVQTEELDKVVQPIIDSCTKDAISGGKNWIFTHNITQQHGDLIAQYLLKRITSKDASFELRLHLIYLINDVLHHCVRKNAEDLKKSLEAVVIPIFCSTHIGAGADNQGKLKKLLTLWQSNKYFDPAVIEPGGQGNATYPAFGKGGAAIFKPASPLGMPIAASVIANPAGRQYWFCLRAVVEGEIHAQITAAAIADTASLLPFQSRELKQQLNDPPKAIQQHQNNLLAENASIVNQVTQNIQGQYTALQKQHQDFVNHLNSQLQTQTQTIQQQIALLEQQQQQQQQAPTTSLPQTSQPAPGQMPLPLGAILPATVVAASSSALPTVTQSQAAALSQLGVQQAAGAPPGMPPGGAGPPAGGAPFPPINFSQPPPNFNQPPPGFPPGAVPPMEMLPRGPEFPPGQGPPPFPLPDLSKPPPGFPPVPPQVPLHTEADLTPTVPYFELPAGLMAPLVKLEDSDYRPLDSSDIRLPPPMPPTDRLLAAVEAFYSPPNHDRPRDSDGWEKLGLYEFFKAKQKAKKLKEKERERSPPPRNESPRGRSRSRSRSPQPQRRRRFNSGRRSYSRSKSRSRSRSKSPSPPPARRSRRSRSPSPQRRRRSKSRSLTPPSFMHEPFYQASADVRLGEENKGHQLMKKMGWSGAGLGAAEQGRVEPVDAGEVRTKSDMYRGIGLDVKDPFEQFRKSKSQGFIQRMRGRDDVSK